MTGGKSGDLLGACLRPIHEIYSLPNKIKKNRLHVYLFSSVNNGLSARMHYASVCLSVRSAYLCTCEF